MTSRRRREDKNFNSQEITRDDLQPEDTQSEEEE